MSTIQLTPPSLRASGLPAEYEALTRRLDGVAGRLRLAETLTGLGWFCASIFPITLGVLFVAGFFPLAAWLNGTLIGAWAACVLAAYGRFLHRAIFHRPSYAAIARVIEEHSPRGPEQPALDNALINAVLLGQELVESGKPSTESAQSWIPHVIRELARRSESMPLERSVSWRRPRRALGVAGTMVIVGVFVIGAAPGIFGHGWAVLLHPARFVPQQGAVQILQVMPGDETALAGEMLTFAATVDSPGHRLVDARLQVHFASGKDASYPMLAFGSDNAQYKREGIVAAEDMDYLLTIGDTQSERFHVTVLPQIHMQTMALEATPPAYTGLGKITRVMTGKEAASPFEVPLGSQVRLVVALDMAPHGMVLDVAGGTLVQLMADAGGRQFSTSYPVMKPLQYAILVNDAAGRTLQRFPVGDSAAARGTGGGGGAGSYVISPITDDPPTIVVNEPGQDVDAKPGDKLPLAAHAGDDYGLMQVRLEIAKNDEKEFHTLQSWLSKAGSDGKLPRAMTVRHLLEMPAGEYKLGDTLRYRFVATDNRDLTMLDAALTAQSTASQVFAISFNDTAAAAAKSSKTWDELRKQLTLLLERQIGLRKQAGGLSAELSLDQVHQVTAAILAGQQALRKEMAALAKDFPFEPSMKLVQKSLEVLSVGDCVAAVDRSSDILLLSDTRSLTPLATRLRQHQSRIIDVLQSLLAISAADENHGAQVVDHEGAAPLPSNTARDAWKKLAEDLKNFDREQKAVINATADLAKKPKDDFGQADKEKLAELAATEDKWEQFLNNPLADLSKVVQQDQSTATLLEEMVQMKVELAAAKNALDQKAAQIATTLEQEGLENAQELTTHIERWLAQQPDRTAWQMEDPVTQNDPVMAELPRQLQDMVGDLMDKEEDLTAQMESLASKFVDSADKGVGWDAADGPISNMSAQGVTGNQLPKAMEIQGRSGEGRAGQSSGEMVGASAEGKEGRRTPMRLTNDPFSPGQVDDQSKLPVGGATGGGKKAGLAGEGLEGPGPNDSQAIAQRLAGVQTTLRNQAQRLSLQMHAANFDNFKLLESNAFLGKSQEAIKQYHYQTALFYQQEAVQSLNTAKVLAAGQIHVIADTSAGADPKRQKDIDAAMSGPLPKGYADPVRAYFERLAAPGQ